jgi:hypothetical protein
MPRRRCAIRGKRFNAWQKKNFAKPSEVVVCVERGLAVRTRDEGVGWDFTRESISHGDEHCENGSSLSRFRVTCDSPRRDVVDVVDAVDVEGLYQESDVYLLTNVFCHSLSLCRSVCRLFSFWCSRAVDHAVSNPRWSVLGFETCLRRHDMIEYLGASLV